MVIDITTLTNSIKSFAQEGTAFIYVAAMTTGVVFGLMALIDVAKKGDSGGGYGQSKSWGSIIGRLIFASCLVTLGRKLEMIIATNGSTEAIRTALSYASGTTGAAGSSTLAIVWAAISAWAVFMGMIGFMRAFLLFDKASQGGQDSGDTFWRGLWHLVGGALCVNIFTA
jgi:hypothetical protein